MPSNPEEADSKPQLCHPTTSRHSATPIIVTDLVSGKVWTFASKSAFLDCPLFEEYYARRHDFIVECGCKDDSRAPLYGRKKKKVNPPKKELCTQIEKDADWPHEWDCLNWTKDRTPRPDEPLTKVDRHSGTIILLTANPLTPFSSASEGELPSKASQTRGRVSGPSTLAGSILFALDAADLNTYTPATPVTNWSEAAVRLGSAIDGLRGHNQAEDNFQVVSERSRLNFARLPFHSAASGEVTTPKRVLCCIKSTRNVGGLTYLSIEGFPYEIEIQRSRWEYAIRRSTSRHTRKALKGMNDSRKNAHVVALLEVTRDASNAAVAHAAGLCAVSKTFIPVESRYELDVANRLSRLGFAFTKDIYIPAGHCFRFDFRVFLEDGEFIIEVHGMDSKGYLIGKEPIEAHLQTRYPRRHLIWRAYLGHPIPRLPRLIAENFYEESVSDQIVA